MVCPICNTEFYDENGRCPNCNEYAEVAIQRCKVNEAVSRTGNILSEIFKSKRFLTYCVILSVICGLYAIAFFYEIPSTNIVSAALSYGLYIGFGVVSLVAAWKLYSQSTNESRRELLTKFNSYQKLMRVMTVISFVLYVIAISGIMLGFFILLGNLKAIDSEIIPQIKAAIVEMQATGELVLDEGMTTEKMFEMLDWISKHIVAVMIAAIVLVGGVVVFTYYKMKAYKSITDFISNLESTTVTFAYISPIKFSSKLILVIGIIDIVIAAPSALLVGIGALAPVMQGVLLIITSKLFAEINTRLEENAREVFEERRILDNMIMFYRSKEN